MARLTAGVGSSHVPLLGVAVDQGKTRDDYFGPIFAGYDWTREWEKAEKPDVVILAHGQPSDPARAAAELAGFAARVAEYLPDRRVLAANGAGRLDRDDPAATLPGANAAHRFSTAAHDVSTCKNRPALS